jgi:hypothetical protein
MQNLTSDVRKCIAYGYTDETTISVGPKNPIEFTEYYIGDSIESCDRKADFL